MANKKIDKKARTKTAGNISKSSPANNSSPFASKFALIITAGCIAVIVFAFFGNSLANLFTDWDDTSYVVNNALVKNLTAQGIKDIFSLSNPVMGNYHPITILSYAIEYHYFQLDPWIYHFNSLFLHVCNTLLIFWFIQLLTGRFAAALTTALLFGLHPMHVESVAWISGRKDVLYGFFYLWACITWLLYLRGQGRIKWLYYILTFGLFICSILSKPVAVTLPLVLLLIDYRENKKISVSIFLDKIPFFVLALIGGIVSVKAQASASALATSSTGFSFLERGLLGLYSLVTYLWKAILPVNLRNFYPYPGKPSSLPATLYLCPILILALIGVIWKYARHNRAIIFGLLFFIANIVLLLQFIPVGTAIVADRYSYISYIGLFFIAGWFVSEYFKEKLNSTTGNLILGGVLLYCLILGYLTHERNKVWYDSMSLWYSNLNMLPIDPNAYNNLGHCYYLRGLEMTDPILQKRDYDSAITLLKKCVEIKPDFTQSYIMMGEIMRNRGNYNESLQNFNMATQITGGDGSPYLSKAILYCIMHKLDSAKINFDVALQKSSYFPEAHSSYGNYFDMTGQYDSALAHYGIAIAQNPDFEMAYLNRGKMYLYRFNEVSKAKADFEKVVQHKPSNGEGYYFLGICAYRDGNKAEAKRYMDKSVSLGYSGNDPAMYKEINK